MLGVSVAAHGGRVYYWDRENTRALSGARVRGDPRRTRRLARGTRGSAFVYAEYPRLDPAGPPRHSARSSRTSRSSSMTRCARRSPSSAVTQTRSAISRLSYRSRDASDPRGGAVFVLDNVGHEFTDRPRGSGAKLDVIPQAFKVSCAIPFSPASAGQDRDRVHALALSATSVGCGRWPSAPAPGNCRGPATRTPTAKAAREIADRRRAFERACVATCANTRHLVATPSWTR